MKKTIFKQIITIYILLSFFLLITVGIYFLQYLHKEQFRVSIEKTSLLWNNLAYNIDDISLSLNSPVLNERISKLSEYLNAMIFIYDDKDRIIARYIDGHLDDTEYEKSDLESLVRFEIKTSMLSQAGKHFNIKEYFVSSYPIFYKSSLNGYFVIIQNRQEILHSWNEFIGDVLQIIILVFIISLIIFIIFAQKLVRPVKHLTKVASLINVKNMDIPIIDTDKNEIGELANQFRQMSANLKQSFEEINSQKEILLSTINSIHQAIWIVDEKTNIEMANSHFEKLIQNREYHKKYLFDLLRNHDIIKIYQDTVSSKTHITREIEFDDKICLCTSSYIKTSRSIIFALLDISDIKSVEKLKKDFISNVSHELKTPLTAIKGFVETLLEDASNEQKHYLEIVNRNTDRLIFIVNDLLSLSKLEQANELLKQEIIISDFFVIIEKIFVEVLKNENITIKYKLDGVITKIFADEFKLEQVFINLIDNAIKYAGKGVIEISAKKIENKVEFIVADEGSGIPKKHLKRIFERFYVVDPSRSRRIGGTGLGLSIVKHIINLHNGEIKVESEENRGCRFIILLPID